MRMCFLWMSLGVWRTNTEDKLAAIDDNCLPCHRLDRRKSTGLQLHPLTDPAKMVVYAGTACSAATELWKCHCVLKSIDGGTN